MTINDLIDILSSIPSRERDRPFTLIGDQIVSRNNFDANPEYDISWIDCSDGLLLIVNEEGEK